MRSFITASILLTIFFAAFGFFRFSSIGGEAIWQMSQQGKLLLPLVGVSAMLDSVNPCAISLLLVTIAFLFSVGKARGGILKIGLAYIFGIFLAYFLIGLGLLQAFHLFNTPNFMGLIGASLLVLLGALSILQFFLPQFPLSFKIPDAVHRPMAKLMERGSVPAAFLLGGLVGVCEFPCTGGPYLMVLGMLHDQASYLKGVAYLVFYNIIFTLPLVLILLLSGNTVVVEKIQMWQRTRRKVLRLGTGIGMIALGVIIFLL